MQHDVQLHLVASSVVHLHRTLEACYCYYLALVVVVVVDLVVVVVLWETELVFSVSLPLLLLCLRECLHGSTDMSVDAPAMIEDSKNEIYDHKEELSHVHHVPFVLDR